MTPLIDRIAHTIDAIAEGDIGARVVPIGDGDSREHRIAHGLNRFLDIVDATLKEAHGATTAAAGGESIRRPIVRGIPGDAAVTLHAIGDALTLLERQAHEIAEQRSRRHAAALSFHDQVGRLLAQVGKSAGRLVEAMTELQADLEQSAASMEQLGDDVKHVHEHLGSIAATTTELHATASEIGQRAAGAAALVKRSNQEGRGVLERIGELEGTFVEVSRSMKFIDGIARETRMLALNATIEAAHAGEAGRGFGVVAGEVKELAREAANAMRDVGGQLERMGTATQESTTGVGSVVTALGEIGQATASVAAAVHQQHAAVGHLDEQTSAVRTASTRMSGRAGSLRASMVRTHEAMTDLARVAQSLTTEARSLETAASRFAKELDLADADDD